MAQTATNPQKTWWKWVYGSACLIIIVAGLYIWSRPSLDWVAKRGVACVIRGDGDCVYEPTPQVEREAYGMPKEAYSRVLKEVVLPHIRSVGRETEVLIGDNGVALASHEIITPEGRQWSIGAGASETDEGIKSPSLLTLAVMSACMSENQGGVAGVAKARSQIVFIQKNRAKLEEIGMKGFYRSPDEGLWTWDKWVVHCEEAIARDAANRNEK
ncbi:MAG: hypothetical protein JSS71_11365 [Armatimonadetes bacterium]|nr:hypothetical protein [Armatimonadota bacterium]MBX3108021.1 hypothetical protein [Fimbriimonadaceae bacterium]